MNIRITNQETFFSIFSKKISLSNKSEPIDTARSPYANLEQKSIIRPKIGLMPTFYKIPVIQATDNLERVGEIIRRIAKRIHKKMSESKRGQKLIAAASEYSIPYDQDNIDWLLLISQIEEYKSLLNQVKYYSLEIGTKYYDLGAMKLIEDHNMI